MLGWLHVMLPLQSATLEGCQSEDFIWQLLAGPCVADVCSDQSSKSCAQRMDSCARNVACPVVGFRVPKCCPNHLQSSGGLSYLLCRMQENSQGFLQWHLPEALFTCNNYSLKHFKRICPQLVTCVRMHTGLCRATLTRSENP